MKKNNIKLSIFWVFSFLVIIFMMTFSSHAADPDTYPFNIKNAYIVDDNGDNKVINSVFFNYLYNDNDTLISNINSDLSSQNVTYESYLVFISDISNRTTNLHGAQPHFQITYTILTNPTINTNITQSDSFFSVICPITYTNSVNYRQTYTPSTSVNTYQFRAAYNGGTFNSLGTLTFINFTPFTENDYLGSGYYNANYPIIAYNIGDGLLSANDSLCIIDQEVPSFPIGVAVPPPNLVMPDFDGLTAPDKVPPTYTINNYTWTTYTPPTPDFTTLEDSVESLYDLIKYEWGYFRDNINGEFISLQNNIKGLFDYIGQTIQYYGGLIIDAINNGIETFYNNMKALVENIGNQISYIIEPLDQEVIWDNISTTSLVTNINTINTSLSSFQAAFTGVNEPSSYRIPIHLENLPSNWFGTQTTQYIDLGIINGTVKDGLRLFVWAMVTYGLVVTIFDSIANYINGGGDES